MLKKEDLPFKLKVYTIFYNNLLVVNYIISYIYILNFIVINIF